MLISIGIFESLVAPSSQWWPVLNTPFRIVCVLLVMDRPRALGSLDDALQSLYTVTMDYNTQMVKEAYNVALSLAQQHRDRQSQALSVVDKGFTEA